jgi:hypothetical protein
VTSNPDKPEATPESKPTPNADKPESKPESKPAPKDDLKSLPMPELMKKLGHLQTDSLKPRPKSV